MLERGPLPASTLVRASDRQRPVAAVVSGSSRVDSTAFARRLSAALGDRRDSLVRVARSSQEATEAAAEFASVAGVVVAVGGDGTVADIATGIFGSGAALAIVPAGSTNITARSLGIPASVPAAVRLIAGTHRLRPMDIGRSGDRAFLHIAGAGFDAEIFRTADVKLKRRIGWLAYLPAAAAALRLPPSQLSVAIDGMVVEAAAPLVLVANGGSFISPAFRIHHDISVDDGWFDVFVFTATTPAQVAETLSRLGRPSLEDSPYVMRHRARAVRIEAEPRLPVQLDGDVRGSTPVSFSMVHKGIEIVTPPG